MSEVETSIEIAAPPAQVWDVLMDPERLDEWVTIHRRVRDVSDNPLRCDSTLEQTLCIRGVNFKVRWKVVELEPQRLAVWEGRGPARSHAHSRYRLEPSDGGTRFDYANEFRAPGGLLGAAASRALIGGVPEREAHASLKRLKALLEA